MMSFHDQHLSDNAKRLTSMDKEASNTDKQLIANNTDNMDDNINEDIIYLQGKPFWLVTVALAIQVFMVQLEIPVVTTSLVAITSELNGFDQLSWVVTSYLLGYVAVIVIFAKFSDIFGRKLMFMLAIVIFIIFSAACSAAQTMTQLVVFRALQGIGGGGSFSLSQVIVTDLVPPERYSKYVSQLSIVSSLALLLGPIVGGAISSHTTWRWIFIINVPISSASLIFTILGMPKDFGLLRRSDWHMGILQRIISKSTLARIDIPGFFLLFCAVLSLTAGFEEADADFPWKSPYVITLLTISGCLWITLLLWERNVTLKSSTREPVLPWRFFTNRVMVGVLMGLLFLGGPIVVSIFQLPERFQLVYALTGLDAGLRLMPFTLAMPFGTIIVSAVGGKVKAPAIFILFAGSCLQIIGFALLGTLPVTLDIPARIYGFEILAGFGCGMNFMPLFLVIPKTVELRDQAVGMGAGNQFRMIGSAIVIAVSTSVLNNYLRAQLPSLLGASEDNPFQSLGKDLASLPPDLQNEVRLLLAEGFNRQMLVLCASAAAQVPASLLIWKKKQISI